MRTRLEHRHHHKFIKYEKRLRKDGNMLGLPILEFAPSNGNGPTDPIYPAFVPFGR
jgi:hypothetical protein